MKCTWCHRESEKKIHNECATQMENERAQVKGLWMTILDEKAHIMLREGDVPKDQFYKFKHRDRNKLSRTEVMNQKLNLTLYESKE